MPADGKSAVNRKNLVKRERATNGEVLRAFRQSYGRIKTNFDELIGEIETAMQRGENISPAKLLERNRLQTVLGELSAEIDRLSLELGQITGKAQRAGVLAAIGESKDYLGLEKAISGEFYGLDKEAASELVGVGGNGQPLGNLFSRIKQPLIDRVKDSLVTGVIAGSSAQTIAKEIREALGTSTAHALTIARTETNRAYREASRQIYDANKNILRGYVWLSALDLNTCPMCWGLHGRIFPTAEKFATHPNCRCTLAPSLKNQPKIKTGADSFRELTKAQQKAILGTKRFDLYDAGKIDLDGLIGEKKTEFGKVRFLKPIGELENAANPKPIKKKVEKTTATAKPKTVKAETVNDYNFKNFKEAELFFEAKYPGKVFDFSGTKPGVLNPSLKSFDRLAGEFPEVMERLKYFGTYKTKLIPITDTLTVDPKTKNPYNRYLRWGRGVVAHATTDGRRLGINPALYGNETRMREAQNYGAQTGHYSKFRKDRVDCTIIHEFGHHVENWLKTYSDQSLTGIIRADDRGLFGDLYGRHRKKYKATAAGVSRYATTNGAEGFAETFTSFQIEPRAAWSNETQGMEKLLKGFRKHRRNLVSFDNSSEFRDLTDPGKREKAIEKLRAVYKDFGLDFDVD